MINTLLASIVATLSITLGQTLALPGASAVAKIWPQENIVATRSMSLENRHKVESVNEVMKKNILLNIAYLKGDVAQKSDINWVSVLEPSTFEFTLKPGEVFAYHDIVRAEYKGKLAVTSSTNFNAADGYLSDGYLYGDGVCHLASLINWAAVDAGLEVVVPKDHRSVATINEIPDDFGVSIYKNAAANIGANNNLYITNNLDSDVTFRIEYDGSDILKVSVIEAVNSALG